MKKKTLLLAAAAAALLLGSDAFATSFMRIIVRPSTPIRRSVQPITVQDNTADCLVLRFGASLGLLSLEVRSEDGAALYTDNVQAAAGGAYSIPVAAWEPGFYTLTVAAGGSAYTWELELTEE